MMRGKRFWIWSAVLLLLSFISLAWAQVDSKEYTSPNMSDKMKTAIEKSLQDEKFVEKTKAAVKPGEEPGYLGIPGGPSPSMIAGFLWAIWVGWLFSTIGAFGGMMAGIGHITVFGLGPYGQSFGKGNPVNSLIVDSIRVSNQWLVGFSGLVSSINYYKMGRLVLPIALCLAIGGVGGSWLIPELTAGKISFRAYVGYFGIIIMVLGCFLLYELTPRGSSRKKEAKQAAKAFEQSVKEKKDSADKGVKLVEGNKTMMWLGAALVVASALWINLIDGAKIVAYILCLAGWIVGFMIGTVKFTFYGVEFKFKAYLPVLGGIIIAAIAAFLGIGGGFLFVPFMTSLVGLPMFVVAGTSTLCVFLGMIVSIFTYMVGKGILVSWGFILAELVGIFVGSMIGPRTSKYIPDKMQKIFFVILAFYVGIRYASQGFLGYKILP